MISEVSSFPSFTRKYRYINSFVLDSEKTEFCPLKPWNFKLLFENFKQAFRSFAILTPGLSRFCPFSSLIYLLLFAYRKSKRNSAPDDIPIRLAVTFAPSRARVMAGLHGAAVYARLVEQSPLVSVARVMAVFMDQLFTVGKFTCQHRTEHGQGHGRPSRCCCLCQVSLVVNFVPGHGWSSWSCCLRQVILVLSCTKQWLGHGCLHGAAVYAR